MKFNHLNVPSHWQNYWTRYPEGHTILEALISWVSQVDSMVDNQNTLNANVEQFRNEIDEFIGRFDDRLQTEVTQTLREWQNSGFLDVVISEALQWELDNYKVTNEQNILSINQQLDETTNKIEQQMVHVTDFGFVGNANYRNPISGGLYVDAQYTELAHDDTAAIQLAINKALKIGGVVYIPSNCRVTDTLSLTNAEYKKPIKISGKGGQTTIMYFDNTTINKNMFFVGNDVNYFSVNGIHFIDTHYRTSRCFYFQDDRTSSAPSWKHFFNDFRIVAFKEGVRYDGGGLSSNDAHLDGVTYIHGKFRNCGTGVVYNNSQAVNHTYLNVDFENDEPLDAIEKWKHFKFEKGAFVNHIGGSVIGYGPYVWYSFPNNQVSFAATSQFNSQGIRIEGRGNGPFIHHGEDSDIIYSNLFRIVMNNTGFSSDQLNNPERNVTFLKTGGRTYIEINNLRTNLLVAIKGVVTANLAAGPQTGQIKITNSYNVQYQRIVNEIGYGSTTATPSSTLATIPCDITTVTDNATNIKDTDDYTRTTISESTYLPSNISVTNIKTLAYSPPTTGGFGAGLSSYGFKLKLPFMGRPLKLRLLKDNNNVSAPIVISLKFVIEEVEHTVATITTTGVYGHQEANITPPNNAMEKLINDGINWDGKMIIEKTGSINAFVGLIMIDYI